VQEGKLDVSAWLRGLRLDRYEQRFRKNDIDGEVLTELTVEDLADLGVTSIGHRRKNSSAPKRATSFGQLKRWMCPISIAGGTLQANNASQVTPRGIPVESWQN
jgi:hypothetical protein